MKLTTQLIFYCHCLLILKWAWQKIFYPPKLDSKYQPTLYLVGQSYMLLALLWDPPNHEGLWDPFSFLSFFFRYLFFNLVVGFKQELELYFFVYLLQIKRKKKEFYLGPHETLLKSTWKSVSIWSSIYSSISLDDRAFGHH